jgi:hypothetical protein
MTLQWTPDPCIGQAGWKPLTVCRRPYGRGSYGRGPYGRCAIVDGSVWGEDIVCAPVFGPPAATPYPWRRRRA